MQKLFFCFMVMLLSGQYAFCQQSNGFKWLEGNWKISMPNGAMLEQWHIINDSTLNGRSILIKNTTDTIPQETVELAYRNGDWYYIPTVAGQNENEPVRFKVIFLKGTEFICENSAHDFPQRIAYRRIKSQLFASIEGKKNGKYGKQNFDYLTSDL